MVERAAGIDEDLKVLMRYCALWLEQRVRAAAEWDTGSETEKWSRPQPAWDGDYSLGYSRDISGGQGPPPSLPLTPQTLEPEL